MSEAALSTEAMYLPPARRRTPLARLRIKHLRVLSLHMQGGSNTEIATLLEVTPAFVANTIRDELSQEVIAAGLADYEHELKALAPLVVERTRRALRDGDHKDALGAANFWAKTQGKFAATEKTASSAEDVVQKILQIRSEGPVEITLAEQDVRRGTGFVDGPDDQS